MPTPISAKLEGILVIFNNIARKDKKGKKTVPALYYQLYFPWFGSFNKKELFVVSSLGGDGGSFLVVGPPPPPNPPSEMRCLTSVQINK